MVARACWDRSPALVVAFLVITSAVLQATAWIAVDTTPLSAKSADASATTLRHPFNSHTAKSASGDAGPNPAEAGPIPPRTASAAPSSPSTGEVPMTDVVGKLKENGAGVCATAVNRLAAGTMSGVTDFNVASHWMVAAPDRRAVSVLIGQKFKRDGAVPFGATGIVAAPNGTGSCDGVAVQVVPSPLPCARIRDALSAHGRLIGDLAGLPLMEDAGGQTLLVPTAANTCVLLGMKSSYAG